MITNKFSIKAIAALLFTSALLLSCVSRPDFVKVEEAQFVSGTMPQYYVGTNFWYGPMLAASSDESDMQRLCAELDSLKAIGITNLRVLAMADGEDGSAVKVRPAFHTAPGEYAAEGIEGLRTFLCELEKRGMSAVLYLNNAWEWSGGYGSYLEWAGREKTPDTRTDGYEAYMNFVADFITDEKAQELYFDHLRHIVALYKDSPAIFSWQLANEPRCFTDDPAVQERFVKLLWDAAGVIKSVDPKHMVSTGNEGSMGCEGNIGLYERIHSCPDIDYLTIHIWPYNWSWVGESTLEEDLTSAIEKTDKYIDAHLAIARRLGKPVVIEEFGFPRDGFAFEAGSPTCARDSYYRHLFERIESSQICGDVLAGVNFWGWGGLASQTPGHVYWEEGDDYCGDPPQEQQGLNSVYLCDRSTVEIIRNSAEALSGAICTKVPVNDNMFRADGSRDFRILLSSAKAQGAEIDIVAIRDLSLMSEIKDTVLTARRSLMLAAGKVSELVFDMGSLEPGFYEIHLSVNGKEIKPFNIGFDPEKIVSEPDRAEDFDLFWEQTLAQLAEIPVEASLTLMPEYSSAKRNVYRVEMKSFEGALMGGILAEPNEPGSYPVFIDYMGYGAQPYPYYGDSNPDRIEFLVSVRGQGIFREPEERWIDRGIASKEDFYYRGAYCDVVRAIDFICTREKADLSRLFARGESQGGAFTWIAASLDSRLSAIAPAVPFLSDFEDYSKIVWWPMWEVFETADAAGIDRENLFRTFSYFDVKNFTDRIQCPVFMAFGLQDPTCPPHTNFAGYNQVTSEKQYRCFPLCGHGMWEEQEWGKAREEWFLGHME